MLSNLIGKSLTPTQFKGVYNNTIKINPIQQNVNLCFKPYNGKWVVLKPNKLFVKTLKMLNRKTGTINRYYVTKLINKKGNTIYKITNFT
jgi:hypothetical protein